MATAVQGVLLSQTSPAFLYANSTSHTWPFSAIAEIIDNAYDPDVSASTLHIDVEERMGKTCLLFTDNGNGMTQGKLHKMLSFGYCEKVEINGHKPVGHYGNGFKSGSMRLGKDAIVFTKCLSTMSVGFLSQTYLANIKAETVLVPMITWCNRTNEIIDNESTESNLDAICKHSLFHSKEELLAEFADIQSKTGTRIILYNLKRGNDDKLELDLESHSKDIINPESQELDFSTALRPVMEHVPEYVRSLREYCSILFLKPRMKIMLRGHKVKTKLISKSLSKTEKDVYKPVYLAKPIKIIFGFSNSQEDYGLMLYHRNRLIKAYERVGCQKQANDHGVGVVGVVEVDFLEPIHNKQDFNKTDRYNTCIGALGQKLNDYWYTMTNDSNPAQIEQRLKADWTWVQCDNCLKWRRLPDGFTDEGLPEKWFCYMNPDPTHNRCDVPEEPEDEDELLQRSTYTKVKKKVEPRKNEEMLMRERALKEKEKELAVMQQTIQQSLEPLAPPGSRSHQPTLADLEAAQIELKLAREREAEQTKTIERLKKQQVQIEQGQRNIRNRSMLDMSILKSIAKSGSSPRDAGGYQPGPSQPRRQNHGGMPGSSLGTRMVHGEGPRNNTNSNHSSRPGPGFNPRPGTSQATTPGRPQVGNVLNDIPGNRKRRTPTCKERIALPGGDAVIVTRNETSSSDSNSDTDDCSDVKPMQRKKTNDKRLVVKFPERHKKLKADDCIVIDSGEDDEECGLSPKKPRRESSPEDVKPDVTKLDKDINKNKKAMKGTSSASTALDKVMVVRHVQTDPVTFSEDADNCSDSKNSASDDSKQSLDLVRSQLEETKSHLSSLRRNVGKLLQTILPDLQIDNLEYIDAIVKEMVKVNKDEPKNGNNTSVITAAKTKKS